MSIDIGIVSDTLNIEFAVRTRLLSDALRIYQHFIILLLTLNTLPYRTLGTALLSLLQGYNNIPDAIGQLATMSVILARLQLSVLLRRLIQDIKALYNTLLDTPRLIITMLFTDGLTITRSFQ